MPAWSMPGGHSTSYPCMRLSRDSVSWIVWSRAWPMCSEPVTFGGGMTMEDGGLGAFGGVAVGGRAGHVGRRDGDGERRLVALRVRREVAGRYPLLVPPLLYLTRL